MYFAYKAIRKHYAQKKNGDNDFKTSDAPSVAGSSTLTAAHTPIPTRNKVDKKWTLILVFALALPVFLETLDYTVVATATTSISSGFNRLDLQSYIGSLYLLTSTVFLLPFASVADIYGRHLALQWALVFFIIGSALSTAAQNMPMMLAGRAVAGIGAAGLLSLVRIIMSDTSSLDQNNWQNTLLFLLYSVAFAVGPVIGGSLITITFRWIFGINLPMCALAMVIAFFVLRKRIKGGSPSKRHPPAAGHSETALDKLLRIDWVGTCLFAIGGILVLLALGWGSSEAWNTVKVMVSFVVGGVLVIFFILWEYLLERQEITKRPSGWRPLWADPVLPLAIFKSYDISALQFVSFVSGMVMMVMFYFIAIFMVLIAGKSPSSSGVQLLYFAPGAGAGSLVSISIIKVTRQPRYAIILGSLILPVSLGLISMVIDENSDENLLKGFLILAGSGVGLTMGSSAIQARFRQPPERLAVVSALMLAFRSLGGTIGIAQCATVLNAQVRTMLTHAIASGAISPSTLSSLTGTSIGSLQTLNSLPPDVQEVVRNAFRSGLRWAFISLIPWVGVSFFLTLFLQKITDGDEAQPQVEEEKKPESTLREVRAGGGGMPSTLPRSSTTDHGSRSYLGRHPSRSQSTRSPEAGGEYIPLEHRTSRHADSRAQVVNPHGRASSNHSRVRE